MVTIWDVAERVGVSKSTVSLVLNNSPLVKEATRQRVLAAIKAMNYVPNYNARSLIKKSNNCIGIIHTLRGDRALKQYYEWNYGLEQFSHDIEDGILEAIMGLSSDLSVVMEHVDLKEAEHKTPKILQNRRVDGAIFVGGFADSDVFEMMKGVELPVVLVTSSRSIEGIDTVFHDSATGTYLAVQKFIETGHKRICLLNCPRSYQVWPERIEGFKKAAGDFGYELDENLLITAEMNTAEGGYRVFSKLLDSGCRPDAVLTADNELALGVLRCLYERRLRVPDDMSIICYEDSSICGNVTPSLSAVNIQKEVIGRTALGFLLDRINSPMLPTRSVIIEPYLVMRSSVRDQNL